MLSLPVANDPHGFGEVDCGAHPIPQARISALSIEHHDLDSVIDALARANTPDDLIIARFKKRRLQIRDEIAGIVVAAQTRDTLGEAIPDFQSDADIDAPAPQAMAMAAAAPKSGGSFVFGVFVTLSVLLMLALGWSDMVDSLNQTLAQIYLLSLLAAANG